MRKGSFFTPIIVIGAIVILFSAIVLLQFKGANVEKDSPIGSKQFDLFQKYQEAENALNYQDISARHTLRWTGRVLANNSGYGVNNPANPMWPLRLSIRGKYVGVNEWGLYDLVGSYPGYPDITNEAWLVFQPYIDIFLERYPVAIPSGSYVLRDYRGDGDRTFIDAKNLEVVVIEKAGKYKVAEAASFSEFNEPDVPGTFEHIRDTFDNLISDGSIPNFNPVSGRVPYLDDTVVPNLKWYDGSCTDVSEAIEYYLQFVEQFVDCERMANNGDPVCTCGDFDTSKIDPNHDYIIRDLPGPDGQPVTTINLRFKDTLTEPDIYKFYIVPNEPISDPNDFFYGYRYMCEKGDDDCNPIPSGWCDTNIQEEREHCGRCEDPVIDFGQFNDRYDCEEGREFCDPNFAGSTAQCRSTTMQQCQYRITSCAYCGCDCDPCPPPPPDPPPDDPPADGFGSSTMYDPEYVVVLEDDPSQEAVEFADSPISEAPFTPLSGMGSFFQTAAESFQEVGTSGCTAPDGITPIQCTKPSCSCSCSCGGGPDTCDIDSAQWCDFDSCTYDHPPSCPRPWSIPPDNTPDALRLDEYPTNFYDFKDNIDDGFLSSHFGNIVIDRDSCNGAIPEEYCSKTNRISPIKFWGDVGIMRGRDSSIVKGVNNFGEMHQLVSSINNPFSLQSGDRSDLERWKACGQKRTWRICVETEEEYEYFDEATKSILLEPIRYRLSAAQPAPIVPADQTNCKGSDAVSPVPILLTPGDPAVIANACGEPVAGCPFPPTSGQLVTFTAWTIGVPLPLQILFIEIDESGDGVYSAAERFDCAAPIELAGGLCNKAGMGPYPAGRTVKYRTTSVDADGVLRVSDEVAFEVPGGVAGTDECFSNAECCSGNCDMNTYPHTCL